MEGRSRHAEEYDRLTRVSADRLDFRFEVYLRCGSKGDFKNARVQRMHVQTQALL